MLKEAIDRIVALANPPKLHEVDGRTYVDGALSLVSPPVPSPFRVSTLSGLVDVLRAKVGDRPSEFITVVESHASVRVLVSTTDEVGRRWALAECVCDGSMGFVFNRWMDRESFVIGLQSNFVESAELTSLLQLTSSMSNEGVTLSEDDGISQKTTFKQGVTLVERKAVRPRWRLSPYRTFREIEQPDSDFVFRMKAESGQVPACALFEADGGQWKLEAMQLIKQYLLDAELPVPIVA